MSSVLQNWKIMILSILPAKSLVLNRTPEDFFLNSGRNVVIFGNDVNARLTY